MSSDYFATLARYNGWANRQLYRACEALAEPEYLRDRGSRFGSLHATLNHILVADRIWIARIEGRSQPGLDLEQILYADLIGLKIARLAEDAHLVNLVSGLAEATLDQRLSYSDRRGDRFDPPLRLALAHLFNHQTQHRGEAQALLAQAGAPVPPLDLLGFVREEASGSGRRRRGAAAPARL